ncbi:MAG: glycosyltransferase family 2 protein [Deltaproteobacteria bacterium]|nr:glycosyltransferase family 2 protein [Deltaproteobacteria bacterium]
MSVNQALIDIIIPNWNGEQMLADCLHSLEKQTFSGFRVIVVDNGSTDGSIALLETEFTDVMILRFSKNSGFTTAVNRGISESSAPWLLLLNNDMEIASDCLENLHRAIKNYPGYQFFALKMMNFHNRQLIDGAGDAVLRGGVGYRLGTMENDSDYYGQDRDTFGACAGAGLYSRKLFEEAGVFDPDFFAYLEDVDLNLRARRRGMQCRYIASAVVYHIGSATSGSKINEFTVRLSTRNNIHVLLKNYSLWMFLRFLPSIVVYQLMWALFSLLKGMIIPYIRGIVQGLKTAPHFLKKRKAILSREKNIREKELVRLIRSAELEAVNSIMARRSAAGKNNLLLICYRKIFL